MSQFYTEELPMTPSLNEIVSQNYLELVQAKLPAIIKKFGQIPKSHQDKVFEVRVKIANKEQLTKSDASVISQIFSHYT